MKRLITKGEHAKLDAKLQTEYKEDGDNFVLDLTDYEDPAELKRAKDREVADKKAATKLAKDLQTQLDTVTAERDGMLEGTVKKDDHEKLKTVYEQRLTKALTDHKTEVETRDTQLTELLQTNVAQELASKLSTSPTLLKPHILSRIVVERVDGKSVTKIKDKDGVISGTLTIKELEKEIIANPEFAPILIGSRGSGGGAQRASGNGGAGSGGAKIDFSKSPKEIAAQMKGAGLVSEE